MVSTLEAQLVIELGVLERFAGRKPGGPRPNLCIGGFPDCDFPGQHSGELSSCVLPPAQASLTRPVSCFRVPAAFIAREESSIWPTGS